MHMIGLVIENLRKIKAAHIEFDGKRLITVRGANQQGKTTLIDALHFLLKGSSVIPEGAVTIGADKSVIIGMFDKYVAKRTITPDGKSLITVKTREENATIGSPQEFLDKISGKFLDPMYFAGLSSLDMRALVLKYSGIDFGPIDQSIKEAEEKRTNIGREKTALGTAIPCEKVEAISIADLLAQRKSVIDKNEAEAINKANHMATFDRTRNSVIEKINAVLKGNYDALSKELSNLAQNVLELKSQYSVAYFEPVSTSDIDAQIQSIEATNEKAAKYKTYVDLDAKIKAKQKEYDDLTVIIEKLRKDRVALGLSAKLPMDGLAITDAGLTHNGVNDRNWSDSEKIKIGVMLAAGYSGELKTIYIKRGESLDAPSLEKLKTFAESEDIQIIIEIVDSSYSGDDGNAIYIEEGEIITPEAKE